MAYRVETTASAERDFWSCYDYIRKHSPIGALHWVDAFDAARTALEQDPGRGQAPESEDSAEEIREKLFKTRHGRPYRILFVLRQDIVYLIHVRGPGQDLMASDEIELPDADDA